MRNEETGLKKNVRDLFERVRKACAQAGRPESEISVVPATKCVPVDVIEQLPALGLFAAGENRIQEFRQKYRADSPLAWHIIGALQTNKVKYAVGKVAMIQSADRLPLIDEIDRLSEKNGIVTDVLIEVNIGAEVNKSGVLPTDAAALAAETVRRKNVRLRGLMSIPPVGAGREPYERMRDLFDTLRKEYAAMDTLSMGMSNDFETAVVCGATMIRPGRILFGERTINAGKGAEQ